MFEIRKDGFYLDGKRFRLFSGAMHYFRVPRGYWEDRLSKLKACGFNCVETVVPWNFHEIKEGVFDFSGMRDIAGYCRAAARLGLYVIVRPGPYMCGEWDFGGFPARLLADKNLRIRCNNPEYLAQVEVWLRAVMEQIAPLQITRGGNIIAMQIENEYGSYGNDKQYLAAVRDILKNCGAEVPFFTSDGVDAAMLSGGTLDGVYKTLNFGSHAARAFESLKGVQDDMPKTCMEFWCGWFDHWKETHHRRISAQVAAELKKIIGMGANVNIYTFHGGTNFAFWAGANYFDKYMPTVTSYDDAALLNEYGDYTPAYHKVRAILHEARGILPGQLPPAPKVQDVGRVALERADLWGNLRRLGGRHESATPESMEKFGQNFGYILYETVVRGRYGANILRFEGVHDAAYVRINGKPVKKYYRTSNRGKKNNDGFTCKCPAFDGEIKLEILVEGMGRINYGPETENDFKGLRKVLLGNQTLFGWNIYTLPLDNLHVADMTKKCAAGEPAIYRGVFRADPGRDCFVDMKGFSKGFVTVNGINLGRYWKVGPQRSLYLPAPFLKEENEIFVFEQEGSRVESLNIGSRHYL